MVLPPDKAWKWATVKAKMNTVSFLDFYSQRENKTSLWTTGATGVELREVQLPRMLALPHILTLSLHTRRVCLPHDLRRAAMELLENENSQLGEDEWQLVLDWCLVASQTDAGGSSLLALDSEVVAM